MLDLSFSDLCLLFYLKMKHKNQMGSTKKNHHEAANKLSSAKGKQKHELNISKFN